MPARSGACKLAAVESFRPRHGKVSALEIMGHCVALPWDAKTGSPPAAGVVRVAGGRGRCGDRVAAGRAGGAQLW